METSWLQTITIICSILIPMLGGFGWLIHRISSLDQRLSRLEGYIQGRDNYLKVKGE